MVKELEASAKTNEIEAYFKKYPDMHREVVIKEDILTQGVWFTKAGLKLTEGSEPDSRWLFSYDLVKMEDTDKEVTGHAPSGMTFKGGLYKLRPTDVRISLSTDTPYVVDAVEGKAVLRAGGAVIADVEFGSPPPHYGKFTADGTPYPAVVAWVGPHSLFVTLFRFCQFWGKS
ncbi:MAG: hypothetical protein Q8O76_15565, partial [Chloroflexota bacterium]|nr:hypothetical protein [Chloroflexota bacterium]